MVMWLRGASACALGDWAQIVAATAAAAAASNVRLIDEMTIGHHIGWGITRPYTISADLKDPYNISWSLAETVQPIGVFHACRACRRVFRAFRAQVVPL